MPHIDLGYWILAIAAIAFCLVFLYAVYLSAREWSLTNWLTHSGILVEGEVIKRYVQSGGKAGRFLVVYRFHVRESDNREVTYTREQQISWGHYFQLTEGTSVTISYLPDSPGISRLAGSDIDNTTRTNSTVIAVIVMITSPLLILLWIAVYFGTRFIVQRQVATQKGIAGV